MHSLFLLERMSQVSVPLLPLHPPRPNSNFTGKADVEKLLKSSGTEVDGEQLDAVINNLKGKKLHELIAAGSKKIATVAAAPAGGAAAPAGGAAAPAKEEKPVEEAANVDIGNVFGDDDEY